MEDNEYRFAELQLSSLQELMASEDEIVRRINETPNGGNLLMLDPQRLFKDLGIQLTPEAEQEWKASQPNFFPQSISPHVYDAMAASRPTKEGLRVIVKGLFRKGTQA
ncbi:MAG TPA: hypothetical protein VFZ40_07670 [Pyrinomonadaceae bacterium]